MRRIRHIAPWSVLLGLLITIGICWLTGHRAYERQYTTSSVFYFPDLCDYRDDFIPPKWSFDVPDSWPPTVEGESQSLLSLFADVSYQNSGEFTAVEQRVGWPLRAMSTEICAIYENSDWTKVDNGIYNAGINTSDAGPLRRLPLKVLPIGFAANWLLYSALCFGILLGPYHALLYYRSSTHRAVRGLCCSCGYEITDLAICPECGTPAKTEVNA